MKTQHTPQNQRYPQAQSQDTSPNVFTEPDQQTPIPLLPLTQYHFHFKAAQDIAAFTFSGSLWHGLWGKALRQYSCTMPDTNCKKCLLLHQCHYSFLFRGTRPPQAKRMRDYSHIPVPHVFQHTEQSVSRLVTGDMFSVDLVFVGHTIYYLPLILQTMHTIGRMGFGKQRYKADLAQVTQQTATGMTQLVLDEQGYYPSTINAPCVYPACPEHIRLQFITPCQLSTKKEHQQHFSLGYFLMGLIRRISHLQYFYTNEILETDFPQLKQLTKQAEQQISDQQLHRSNKKRYSAKHQRFISIAGFMGSIEFSLKQIEALWPYLYLGQQLNTGKNASMGYGQYEMIAIA